MWRPHLVLALSPISFLLSTKGVAVLLLLQPVESSFCAEPPQQLKAEVKRQVRLVDWHTLPVQRYTQVISNLNMTDHEDTSPSSMFEMEHARQRKLKAQKATELSRRRLSRDEIIQNCILYHDEYIVVANKPSGVLCVPGARDNDSLANVVYDYFGCETNRVDQMIVHRLDMHTSGLVVFARKEEALKNLHTAFRDRKVRKQYEALVCGSLVSNFGDVNLPLQRDPNSAPFMRVATAASQEESARIIAALEHEGYKKMLRKPPKESLTTFQVVGREAYGGQSCTRVRLVPVTGRTHQLRVHCAAIGHPIIADPAYGYMGEAASNGGFTEDAMDEIYPRRAGTELQRLIDEQVQLDGKKLCLHAKLLCFSHPITGAPLTFEAPSPF